MASRNEFPLVPLHRGPDASRGRRELSSDQNWPPPREGCWLSRAAHWAVCPTSPSAQSQWRCPNVRVGEGVKEIRNRHYQPALQDAALLAVTGVAVVAEMATVMTTVVSSVGTPGVVVRGPQVLGDRRASSSFLLPSMYPRTGPHTVLTTKCFGDKRRGLCCSLNSRIRDDGRDDRGRDHGPVGSLRWEQLSVLTPTAPRCLSCESLASLPTIAPPIGT